MGAGGKPMQLMNAAQPLDIFLPGVDGGRSEGVDLPDVLPLIGDLPAFELGLGVDADTPAVILGLDALTARARVVMCLKSDCIYVGGDMPIEVESSAVITK